MARSHHRKKHKEHLRSYQNSQGNLAAKSKKTKVTGIFSALGAALGFAIVFFASGSTLWLVVCAAAGGVAGYLIGRSIDGQPGK